MNIYALSEPNGPVRYVGKTVSALRHRLIDHLSEARRGHRTDARCEWLRSVPVVEIDLVAEVDGDGKREERELIAGLRALGILLVNGTQGGDGGVGGKSKTPSHVENSRVANIGKHSRPVHSAEVRALMSLTRKGRKMSEETKAKLSASKMGHRHSAETKARIAAANRARREMK